MLVTDILKQKGREIVSISATQTTRSAAQMLADNNIGALVALDPDGAPEGILSERDIIDGIARHGAEALDLQIGIFLTRSMVHCSPRDTLLDVARTMTQRRIRHLPVVEGSQLIGLVSIGDVLKCRISEVELESLVLRDVAIALR
ncbi:MAG: CBS domain-containing protein [Alphaproteobacteria bacterium]|nr:CBS domain-containing protein [Alphaproteobacteria bacterium]